MFEHQWGESKLAPYSLTFHYAHIVYIGKVHDIVYHCRSVSKFRILSHALEAVHCHSVGLLIIAFIDVGTRKWSSV